MALARLSHLTYRYPVGGTDALAAASLEIEPGLTVVVGDSGGGKSTLLRVLNGLVPHFHGGRIGGEARVCGFDVLRTPTRELARRVGFVFQDPEVQLVYGVVEREVAFGLENLAVPAAEMRDRVDSALALAGIGHLGSRRVGVLSGGERQRVALAGALALGQPLVVLDEPTSQLDPDGAERLIDACLRLAREGHAVVVAEHRLDRLGPAAGDLVKVEGGRVDKIPYASTATCAATPRPAGGSAAGDQVWSLSGVAAGPGRHQVLEGIDLEGRQGEAIVLSGPNGGGKTTLLRTLAGLLPPLAGQVERRPGRVAYLPQNPSALLHRPTVRDEVELTLCRAGDPEPAERILQMLGLLEVADRYPRDLSTGERQRAALAAILAGSPALALLDEPTRGMDAHARHALARLVWELKERGGSVVVATHDVDLAAAVGDRHLVVARGKIRET